ncbi:tetratricopeptide repeat protein [Neisseriaceae bacterium B1]
MDPMMLALVGVLVLAVVILIAAKKKQAAGAKVKGSKKVAKGKAAQKIVAEEEKSEESASSTESAEEETWDWGVSSHVVDDTKVSVTDVDALTEFNVYKQFGYFDKAAESLAAYLQNNPQKADANLVNELTGLWLEAKNPDAVAESIMQYQSLFTPEQLTEYIKGGLALDENHLGLRVLAESTLGWSVKKTAEEIGEKTVQQAPATRPEREAVKSRAKQKAEAAEQEQKVARKMLVNGVSSLVDLSNDEKGAVLAFMEPEKSFRLLRDSLSYDAAVKYLNKAIRSSTKPAALLIDALTLDYRANNINGFAGHLWNLYYSLGQYGRQVKERMLGWGYSLGQHPMFEKLETNPSEASLREIGMQQGFIDGGSMKKARYQALVSEKVDVDGEPRTPVERILKEAESLLMYGQLDNSMELLENAILEYPQESQLYITLFDLYERAEEWERLENMLQQLRSQVQTLPEEVVLAMSQLLQRFNNGSFGH